MSAETIGVTIARLLLVSQRGDARNAAAEPAVIAAYRRDHPAVTFSARSCNRHGAEPVLADYSADLAMVYEGDKGPSLQIVAKQAQTAHLLCHVKHPLAGEGTVRLRDCLDYPMALPTRANGVRTLLERAAGRLERPLPIAVESDSFGLLRRCPIDDGTVSFQVPIALSPVGEDDLLCRRAVDARDLRAGALLVGRLRGRTLPVAAARFVERVAAALDAM